MQEELSIFQARSFWLMVGAAIVSLAKVAKIDMGVDPDTIADAAMNLIPVILAGWAYVERLRGKKKLVVRRAK